MTELWRLGAADMAAKVNAGEISASELTQQTLQRLEAVNPHLNAVVQQMPDEAMAAAKAVDARVAAGEDAGMLAGVPVTIKVNIDQAGYPNTNGLRIQQDHVPASDSPVVTNLRNAGAIIVGRTNTPAFSMRWFTRNSLHGHTLNPRNTGLTPGGSSGGAAAAVAAGICAIGHGTDIAGSIRYPAYACGLQGIRPTLGRIPAVNLSMPDRHIGAQMTAVSGPIARSVADLEVGLAAMAAPSDFDPWWVPAPLSGEPLPKRAALCVAPEGLPVTDEVEAALREAARKLEDAGWEVVEVDCPPLREAMDRQLIMWMSEYHYNRGEAIAKEDDPDANFVFARMCEIQSKPSLEEFMETLQRRIAMSREWQLFLSQYPVLLCPVSAELPFADQSDVESAESFARIVEAQMLQIGLPFVGIPAMTVTTGQVNDAPIGVQLAGPRFREDVLFDAARAIESRSRAITVAMAD
jgi:amidase